STTTFSPKCSLAWRIRRPRQLDSAAELVEGENPALEQIQARGYSEKYRGKASQGLFELGLVFGREERNLIQADWLKIHEIEGVTAKLKTVRH
ncbi:MAG: PD-(D/E)XK nuclease domain-containing protein, partial [Gammaproteobacteria bacterium SHHR-1]